MNRSAAIFLAILCLCLLLPGAAAAAEAGSPQGAPPPGHAVTDGSGQPPGQSPAAPVMSQNATPQDDGQKKPEKAEKKKKKKFKESKKAGPKKGQENAPKTDAAVPQASPEPVVKGEEAVKSGDVKKEEPPKEQPAENQPAKDEPVKAEPEKDEKPPAEASPSPVPPLEKSKLNLPVPGTTDETGGTPRVTAVEIRGNQNVSTEEILGVIRSKVGDPVIEPRIRSDAQGIFEMGYFTDVKVDTPYHAGGLKLVFRVQENPIVTRIEILGNKMVKLETLKGLIQTREGKILNMKTLNADMNEINYYYDETLGYSLKPTHIKNINWTPSGELLLTIDEGMVINEVKITGSSLYTEEKLRSMVKSTPGMLFNTTDIKKDTTSISKFYEDEGYILDTVRPQVNYREGIVTIQVIEAMVEDIKLEFDESEKRKTKEYVVFRNIRTKKGEVLQRKKLQRDIERLNNLGFFSKVNVDPEPGSKPGNTVLVFKLKEQKTGLATIGVGYTGGGSGALRPGITGAISYRESNMGGTGQGVSVSWQRGVNIDASSISYTNPAINANQDSIMVSVFRHNYIELRQPLDNNINNGKYALYDDKRSGAVINYGRRITDDFRVFLGVRRENLTISRSANSEFKPIGLSSGVLNAASVGALFDTRNDVFDPVDGWFVDASYTYGGKALKGNYDFNKSMGEIRKYIPIGKRQTSTIALRAWGGSVSGSAPITETFYVGGMDTIRGYNENEFIGTRMLVLNAEYRFSIANIKFIKGAIFGDAGNAWFPSDARKRLYTDYGAGLRIVFPTLGLGVIRLDYARGERGGRTSVGIGQTF